MAELKTKADHIRTAGITTLQGIAAELNERGILTARKGGHWYATTLRNLLARSARLLYPSRTAAGQQTQGRPRVVEDLRGRASSLRIGL